MQVKLDPFARREAEASAKSICWQARIRVRAITSPQAPRFCPILPASSLLHTRATHSFNDQRELDWRVLGDQDL
jgi:hypothetical protein